MGVTRFDLEKMERHAVESLRRQEDARAGKPPINLLPNQLPFGSGRFTADEMRQGFKKLRAGKE